MFLGGSLEVVVMVYTLLTRKTNPWTCEFVNLTDQYGASPLYIAARQGNDLVVEFLLTIPGIEVNGFDFLTPIGAAIQW